MVRDHGQQRISTVHRRRDVFGVRVEPVESAFAGRGVGVDDPNERLGLAHRQAAADQHRTLVVVGELQEPVTHCCAVLALEPCGVELLGRLRGEHLQQSTAQSAQFGGVVGGREADHQLLPLRDHLGGEVVGERIQHAGDGLCLGRQHSARRRPGGDDAEPCETLPGSHQPGGFAASQVRRIGEPCGRRGAVLLPGHLGGVHMRGELGEPGVQLAFQL